MVSLRSFLMREYACPRQNHNIRFQKHRISGTGVFIGDKLHYRRQRGGEDKPYRCDILSFDDKKRFQPVGQIQLAERMRKVFPQRALFV